MLITCGSLQLRDGPRIHEGHTKTCPATCQRSGSLLSMGICPIILETPREGFLRKITGIDTHIGILFKEQP